MGVSSKFKPGIVALVAVGVVQLATALPQIEVRVLHSTFPHRDGKHQSVRSNVTSSSSATALHILFFQKQTLNVNVVPSIWMIRFSLSLAPSSSTIEHNRATFNVLLHCALC